MTKRMVALVARMQKADRAIEKSVWQSGVATFDEHSRFSGELDKMDLPPHTKLFVKASRYIQLLSAEKPEHASAIMALGEVISFSGALLAAYEPHDQNETDKTH